MGYASARGLTITANQLSAWTGHRLTEEQIERLEDCIDHSSIPEALETMAFSMFSDDPGWIDQEVGDND